MVVMLSPYEFSQMAELLVTVRQGFLVLCCGDSYDLIAVVACPSILVALVVATGVIADPTPKMTADVIDIAFCHGDSLRIDSRSFVPCTCNGAFCGLS